MTPKDVRARVATIKAAMRDSETAHFLEDQLWEDALQSIAKGTEFPASLAQEALKTRQLNYERWYA